jgi:hypothetical protein
MESNRLIRLARGTGMLLATAGILLVLAGLMRSPRLPAQWDAATGVAPSLSNAIQIGDDGTIAIDERSGVRKHLDAVTLAPASVRIPALTVSGAILARITPGEAPLEDRWQFGNTELAATYAEWLRMRGEVKFLAGQLEKTQELFRAETGYLEANVRRLEPLWKSGNLPERDYKAAEADLLKAQLQGEKDVFAAESALRVASNSLTALDRDLAREGIDPRIFARPREDLVIVGVQIPETRIAQVASGQRCFARFYAFPKETFESELQLLSSQLSHERRTMRALFELEDPRDRLRPGMFTEVHLGTDQRDALLIPAEALLRLCDGDYVLRQIDGRTWKPVVVQVGGQFRRQFEILDGLRAGETIATRGAILLKPAATRILCDPGSEGARDD